jgi:hypothetical protein
VTYSDADTVTVSSVTSQTTDDVIVAFVFHQTITAFTGTGTSYVTYSSTDVIDLKSYEVMVNTSRSNAIRRLIYKDTSNRRLYNSAYSLGSTVSSQASGDTIKLYKVMQYSISNHYQAINGETKAQPIYANIATITSGDIDTFDMEELVADKGVPAGAIVNAVVPTIVGYDEAGISSQIKPVLRIGATDYEGSAITLNTLTKEYTQNIEVSPATSSAFTVAEVDGLEAGVKFV